MLSPPSVSNLQSKDNQIICEKINTFKPDVLFIGMTAPKQEKWLHQHKDKLEFTISSCIGAVFESPMCGTAERPRTWVNSFRMALQDF